MGGGGSILGDRGVKTLKIIDQNVLGKGKSSACGFKGPGTLVLESQLSHQLKGFVHAMKNKQQTGWLLHVVVFVFHELSVCLCVCLPASHPMLAKQPLHCASQW